ncbi:hypothetical protein SISNIDRAFT_490634 [Sistotremastrum niveocremeum HHB9708]|uniref:Uncharacterized protein n=2 Tax=Sistotremastraceae TaxID=3402574 RepID=A0A164NLH2_9AGAM|nr:hypothetical protein SISNIDRAFT_490634 [Sistotremastrum niveocremeum HHB9708]KZT31296.1 hypothetical protein SISSUDRAFT_1067883 [Sistotremastrum suecicum HHB10207 ss-3]
MPYPLPAKPTELQQLSKPVRRPRLDPFELSGVTDLPSSPTANIPTTGPASITSLLPLSAKPSPPNVPLNAELETTPITAVDPTDSSRPAKLESVVVDEKYPIPLGDLQDQMRLYTEPATPRFLSSPLFILPHSRNILVHSINVHTVPTYAPQLSPPALYANPKLHIFTQPQAYVRAFAWAPLVPLMPRVEITLLAPLRYQSSWPVDSLNHQFALSSELMRDWRSLELRLQGIVQVLIDYCIHKLPSTSWQKHLAAHLILPILPSELGFQRRHHSLEIAQQQAHLAHVAFRLWLGLVLLRVLMKMLPPIPSGYLSGVFLAFARSLLGWPSCKVR